MGAFLMDTPAHPQIIVQTENVDVFYAHKKGLMQQLFPALDEASA